MWYQECFQLADAKAIKAKKPASPSSAIIGMKTRIGTIHDPLTVQYHRTKASSGRCAMVQEFARVFDSKYVDVKLVTLAARQHVSVLVSEVVTAELINIAIKALSSHSGFRYRLC